jgi:hypothetical protein
LAVIAAGLALSSIGFGSGAEGYYGKQHRLPAADSTV